MPLHAYVHIVESPGGRDLLDRRTEGAALSECLRIAEIPHCYCLATTRDTFVHALTQMIDDEIDVGVRRFPIVHLSAHGNAEGIALTDGTTIEWAELRDILGPISLRMRGGLLLCLSSCEGFGGIRMAMRADEEPVFWGLVACQTNVSWSDAAIGFSVFYHQLFKREEIDDYSLEQCAESMRIASGETGFTVSHGARVRQRFLEYSAQRDQERARHEAGAAGLPGLLGREDG